MTARLMPYVGSRPYLVLQALLAGPGTFYQICERVGADIEKAGVEPRMREVFGNLMLAHIKLDQITYSLNTATRLALQGKAAPDVATVAAPHNRGPSQAQPVTVVRRPGRADHAANQITENRV